MKKVIYLIFTFIALTACKSMFDDRPSKAEEFILSTVEKQSKHIQITNFEKTDGKMNNILGKDVYELEFKMDLEFINDGYKIVAFGEKNFGTFRTTDKKSNRSFLEETYKFSKGQKYALEGSVYFEEKESGWYPLTINIKNYNFIQDKK